ncbi:hypothetical protein OS493_004912 [Desmophyllum pertusum]|uniref:Metalloendopeptidase n=1 Tax=Desmophyllum pertusum TaxID=174260 RepID=A0A9W9Z728_9CNID|nr:hypothetical protein OS493_004912 [Desmophyllum pertusum]
MPFQLWAVLLLCLVPSPWVITSGLPSIPNPKVKAAFDQILQANMEIKRDFGSSPPLPDNVFEGDIDLTQEQLMNIDIYGDVRGNKSRAAGSNSRIRWPNGIIPYEIDCSLRFESAFAKYGRDKIDSLGLPYDYGSIMHYPFNAFSKNGQPTLRTLRPLNGKRPYQALSDLDAQQTNKMYGCAAKRRKRRQTACADYNRFCYSWARSGQCQRNPGYMRRYCKRSCGLCTVQPTSCTNRDYRCPTWARYGYCRTNAYTRTNCKKSCGLCSRPKPPTVKPKPPTVRPKPPTVRPKPPTVRPSTDKQANCPKWQLWSKALWVLWPCCQW